MTPQERNVMELALEALEKLTDAAEGFSVSDVYFNEESQNRKFLDDAYDAMGFAQEALAQDSKRPIESDYVSQVAYTRALEAYCDRLELIKRAEEAFEAFEASQIEQPAPRRTWVGLNLDERAACYEASGDNLSKFADQIEAKLKAKNT